MLEQIDPTAAGQLLRADVEAKLTAALQRAQVPEAERLARIEAFRREWSAVNATDAARSLIDRTILFPAIAAIDAGFPDQPVIAAQLRQVLADRYRKLGLYDAALPLQTRALETRRRVLGAGDPRTLLSMDGMGLLLGDRGEYAAAEQCCRAVLETSRRVLGDDDGATLDRISNLGTVLAAQGKLAEAEPYYREALEGQRRVHGEDDPATIPAINNMGFLLVVSG
jgi:non-specific serine/threonine protein kinase/serine/threonine-protein kinase